MSVSIFHIPDNTVLALGSCQLNLAADPFYAVLLDGSFTPFQAMATYADLTGEVASADYARVQLTNVQFSGVSNRKTFTSDNIDFGSNVTISAKYLVILRGSAVAPQASDVIVGWQDLNEKGGDISTITVGNPASVVATAHGLVDGDTIVVANTDMSLINRTFHTVAGSTPNAFTISDTSAALNIATRGRWTALNDTQEQSSTQSNFVINTPIDGWLTIG